MRTESDDRARRTRIVLLVSNAMLVAAALIVTSPWTSGLYTWVVQRRFASEAAPEPPRRPEPRSAEVTPGPALAGWERDDSRDWRSAPRGTAVGRLRVAKLGLDVAVVKGVRAADLRKGPGWIPSTSAPGSGNTGVSGHRTTYLAPFRDIDRLAAGDPIVVTTRRGSYTYRVVRRFFVMREDADILLPTKEPTLTLTSCHPPYSNQFRIVVQAVLVRADRR